MERPNTFFPLIILLCLSFQFSLAQVQIGTDIDGNDFLDFFGGTLALSDDGNRLIVGALANTVNGADAGLVQVYDWTGADWTQLGGDFLGETSGYELGASLAISGDGSRIAMGGPGRLGELGFAGKVYVYEWMNGNWIQLGTGLDGSVNGELFGRSVSLSSDGNVLAIGSPLNSNVANSGGLVQVYEWNGSSWLQKGADFNGTENDLLGSSVNLSADGLRLAVGAIGSEENGSQAGQVRVYEWKNNDWEQVGADINGNVDDFLGCSLSLSADGGRLAVGARGEAFDGKVQVYEWTNGFWIQLGDDFVGGVGDNLGCAASLSADGNRLAIGALGKEDNGNISGQARVFEWFDNEWFQVGSDLNGEENSAFGEAVALSSNGNRLAVGATYATAFGSGFGLVQVYDLTPVSSVLAENTPQLNVFPNPTNGTLNFDGDIPESLLVFDMYGRVVHQERNIGNRIKLEHLPVGAYILKLNFEGQTLSKRIVIQ